MSTAMEGVSAGNFPMFVVLTKPKRLFLFCFTVIITLVSSSLRSQLDFVHIFDVFQLLYSSRYTAIVTITPEKA